jgi:hypothetical protein
METKRLIIILLFFTSLLGAQEYYVKKDGEEARIFQKLAWQKEENALRYEVVIQQWWEETDETNGRAMWGFVEIKREFTADSFIEVSLSPGKYRIMVTAHDLLDRPGIPSEWASLEILKAQVPELLDFTPGLFYLDGTPPWVLTVQGRNFSEGVEMYLQPIEKSKGKAKDNANPKAKSKNIVPIEYATSDTLPETELAAEIAASSAAAAEAETATNVTPAAEPVPEVTPAEAAAIVAAAVVNGAEAAAAAEAEVAAAAAEAATEAEDATEIAAAEAETEAEVEIASGAESGNEAKTSATAIVAAAAGTAAVSKPKVAPKTEPKAAPPAQAKPEEKEQYQKVFLFFDVNQLAAGNYQLVVKNPGGFEANGGPFEIKIKNKFTYFFKRLFRKKAK